MTTCEIIFITVLLVLVFTIGWIGYNGAICLQAVQLGKGMLQIEDSTFEMAEHCGVKNCSAAAMQEAVELVMQSRAAFIEKGKQCLGE